VVFNVDVASTPWYSVVELMGHGTEQGRVKSVVEIAWDNSRPRRRSDGPTLQNSTIYFKHVCIENKTLIIPMRRSKEL
jgi:hypothetical protein